jgi:DNA-nicking Smr family endonuclease
LSPKDLGIRDYDVIVVHDNNMPREASSSVNNKENMADTSSKASLTKTKKNTKAKKISKVKKNLNQNEEHAVADEYYKAQHIKILSKLHQEMQPRLKEIRMKLNTLSLEHQSPKSRKKKSKRIMKEEANHQIVANTGVGGKAGEPNFVVQVGEEQYLYKTHKSSARTSQNIPRNIPTLDLHGCTREEAVVKLNESLKVWVETAMKGSYPFVITAEIICGCGSQVLSETVQTWIKSTSQVRNARKNTCKVCVIQNICLWLEI